MISKKTFPIRLEIQPFPVFYIVSTQCHCQIVYERNIDCFVDFSNFCCCFSVVFSQNSFLHILLNKMSRRKRAKVKFGDIVKNKIQSNVEILVIQLIKMLGYVYRFSGRKPRIG